MTDTTLKHKWEATANKFLKGKTIKSVRYLVDEELEMLGWTNRALVITFTDGSYIFPSQDEEGNGPGALFTSDDGEAMTLPTL